MPVGIGYLQTPLGVAKPNVADPKLQSLVNQLYRQGAKVGTGSTADAIRHELATGGLVGGKGHLQKGVDYAKALWKWISNNSSTASKQDVDAAKSVLRDLFNAFWGK